MSENGVDQAVLSALQQLRLAYRNITSRSIGTPEEINSRIDEILADQSATESDANEVESASELLSQLQDQSADVDTTVVMPDGDVSSTLSPEILGNAEVNLPQLEAIITTAARRQEEPGDPFEFRVLVHRRLSQGASADQLLTELRAAFEETGETPA